MSRTSSSQGEASSYRYGRLKRRLPGAVLFRFAASELPNTGVFTKKVRLEGLSSLLNVSIACGLQQGEGGTPVVYPAAPGTIQVTPFVNPPDIRAPLPIKPLTLVPQTLPHGFAIAGGFAVNGGTFPLMGQFGMCLADGADIEVTVDAAEYQGTGLAASMILVCAAEYNGSWWDVDAIENLLGDFRVSGTKSTLLGTI